ncbi:ATP synthase d subunit [Batrachochytrium dendrobatidis]
MSAAVKTAARIDWSALSSKLKPETMASVNGFRRRHSELLKTVSELREHQVTIDFNRYKNVLKNKKVAEEAERAIKAFKPATIDLTEQLLMVSEQEKRLYVYLVVNRND